jgi:hypothetical protein
MEGGMQGDNPNPPLTSPRPEWMQKAVFMIYVKKHESAGYDDEYYISS